MRIAQLVVAPTRQASFSVVTRLDETSRGAGVLVLRGKQRGNKADRLNVIFSTIIPLHWTEFSRFPRALLCRYCLAKAFSPSLPSSTSHCMPMAAQSPPNHWRCAMTFRLGTLEPVLQALVRQGILRGVRGPRGGYELAREQDRITADDILRAAGTVEEVGEPQQRRSLFSCRWSSPPWRRPSEPFPRHSDASTSSSLPAARKPCSRSPSERAADGSQRFNRPANFW